VATQFYQGIDILTYRSDLPFERVEVDGMVARDDGMVFAGSGVAGAQLVARTTAADSYAAWTNLTGSLNTGKSIKGLAST